MFVLVLRSKDILKEINLKITLSQNIFSVGPARLHQIGIYVQVLKFGYEEWFDFLMKERMGMGIKGKKS